MSNNQSVAMPERRQHKQHRQNIKQIEYCPLEMTADQAEIQIPKL